MVIITRVTFLFFLLGKKERKGRGREERRVTKTEDVNLLKALKGIQKQEVL